MRGDRLRIPADVSVVGFDDITIAGLKQTREPPCHGPLMFQAEQGISACCCFKRIEDPTIAPFATSACQSSGLCVIQQPRRTAGDRRPAAHGKNRVTARRRCVREARRPHAVPARALTAAPARGGRTSLINAGTAARGPMPTKPTIKIVATAFTAGVMPS